jgi:hypothetical protein
LNGFLNEGRFHFPQTRYGNEKAKPSIQFNEFHEFDLFIPFILLARAPANEIEAFLINYKGNMWNNDYLIAMRQNGHSGWHFYDSRQSKKGS